MPAPFNPSLWMATATAPEHPPLDERREFDAVVIGGGITGLTTAMLLKRAGKTVAVVEMNRIGSGATGYTTAKLTVGHNLIYHDLISTHGKETARAYAQSNSSAIELMKTLVAEQAIECDWERAPNYVYTQSPDRVADLEAEARAAQRAGLSVELTTVTDLPFAVLGALRVDDQAQFHPLKYVLALADRVAGDGCAVYEGTRARHVRRGDVCVVETLRGDIRARHVVVATQLPFLDRGLFFVKAHPDKSYAVSAHVDEAAAPRGMYISIEQPTRSIRSTPAGDGGRYVVVGGEGHKPGEESNTELRYDALERFVREHWSGASVRHRWSTHDYRPVDQLPYIGQLRRNEPNVFVATGYAKWGLTKATIAAEIIADAILGRRHRWAGVYDASRLAPRASAMRFTKENANVGYHFVGDRMRRRDGRDEIERLAPGEGTVARVGVRHYAAYRDEHGTIHTVSARCTHLGCLVGWNRADRTWECPCHGSRFAADGRLMQGPATRDLPATRLPDST